MTEYELADYTATLMSNFLSAITIFFSIVTAYVVAAFISGDRLTKLQLVVVNATFTIAAGVMGTLSFLIFSRFFELARLTQSQSQSPIATPLVDFGLPLAILIIAMYIGGLIFMWSVRRKSDDA